MHTRYRALRSIRYFSLRRAAWETRQRGSKCCDKTFLPDAPVCNGFSALATSVPCHGTEVYFPSAKAVISVIREQFWGRAVRASRDSQESGALLIFVATRLLLSH
jgi:hypothetical protein